MRSFLAVATLISALSGVTGCINLAGFDLKEGIYVVNGIGWSGQVLTVIPEPLIVEVRDSSGRIARLVDVDITTTPPEQAELSSSTIHRGMYVCGVSSVDCAQFPNGPDGPGGHVSMTTHVKTDSAGRIYLRAQFGTIAGSSTVSFFVPSLNLRTRLPYTTEPGPMTELYASVRDTTISVGDSYDFIAKALDRFGNQRSDTVLVFTPTNGVIYTDGKSVHGFAPGRAHIVMQRGSMADTVYVTVIPREPAP